MRRAAALALHLLLLCAARRRPVTPETHFGHAMGADRKLLDWSKVVSYFELLSKNSDRIRVDELGKTTEGRPFIVATIAAPETLRNLDRYRQIQARLADPRTTSEAEAAKLVREGKTVVLITCSIHSTEVASTSYGHQMAYKLLRKRLRNISAILAEHNLLAGSITESGRR